MGLHQAPPARIVHAGGAPRFERDDAAALGVSQHFASDDTGADAGRQGCRVGADLIQHGAPQQVRLHAHPAYRAVKQRRAREQAWFDLTAIPQAQVPARHAGHAAQVRECRSNGHRAPARSAVRKGAAQHATAPPLAAQQVRRCRMRMNEIGGLQKKEEGCHAADQHAAQSQGNLAWIADPVCKRLYRMPTFRRRRQLKADCSDGRPTNARPAVAATPVSHWRSAPWPAGSADGNDNPTAGSAARESRP